MADEGLKTGKDKFKDADDRLLVGRLKVGISQKPFLCLFVFWFVLAQNDKFKFQTQYLQ